MRNKAILIFLSLMTILVQMNCKTITADDSGMPTVYYLVSENVVNHNDSFILPLSNPEDISFADKIADGSERARIIVGVIQPGSGDGIYLNRDLLDPDKRIWSWSVAKFEKFADVTAELYDGWPGYLEENLSDWMVQKNGSIGFWNYSVKRRVALSELQ